MPPDQIEWFRAENREAALALLAAADSAPYGEEDERGFDVIFCDLKIPPDSVSHEEHLDHGFAVAEVAAGYQWPTSVIGISAYGRDHDVLLEKLRQFNRRLDSRDDPATAIGMFDDFLLKPEIPGDADVTRAKLRRCIVPTARYVEQAAMWAEPVFFCGRPMWRILRDLVLISREPVVEWSHVPRILFLGDPGSGKGALARAYYQLLREDNPNRPEQWEVVNCASLVAAGEGGRVRLFGADPGSRDLERQPGVFERATRYGAGVDRTTGLASENAEPDYHSSGMVFLDEFVELDRELQAAVLNTLEEGVVYRQVKGKRASIGCHVVCATNAEARSILRRVEVDTSKEEEEGRLRSDLIDRIPYVLTVPALRDRIEELETLLLHLARKRLKKFGEIPERGVQVEPAALKVIERCVRVGLIHSIRQLQTVAAVLPGETIVSDSNLSWMMRKALLLNVSRSVVTGGANDVTIAQMARQLRLPQALHRDDLPQETTSAVRVLYQRLIGELVANGGSVDQAFSPTEEGAESRARFYLMGRFFNPRERVRLYDKASDTVRQAWGRVAEGRVDLSGRDQKAIEGRVVAYLLQGVGSASSSS